MKNYSQILQTRFILGALVTAFLGASFFSPAAHAQRGPEMMKQRMVDRTDALLKVLALEGEKSEVVTKILKKGLEKQLALFAERPTDRAAMGAFREKLGLVDTEVAEELTPVLSEEEMGRYTKFMEERADRPRNGQGRRANDPGNRSGDRQ